MTGAAMGEDKLYDLTFLNKISGGDPTFIREMVDTFREVAPEFLQKAEQYLKSNSIDSLSKETHRFIPGVSFLGARELENDLLKIEEYTKKREKLEEVPDLLNSASIKIKGLIEIFNRDFS
jgi:HPt (histidine-containing phosphotransfer) domain-containing protein